MKPLVLSLFISGLAICGCENECVNGKDGFGNACTSPSASASAKTPNPPPVPAPTPVPAGAAGEQTPDGKLSLITEIGDSSITIRYVLDEVNNNCFVVVGPASKTFVPTSITSVSNLYCRKR